MEAPDREETEYDLAAAILLLWVLHDGIRLTGPAAFEAFMDGFNRLVRPTLTRIYGRARAALADSFGQPYPARPAPSGNGQTILIPGINRRVEQYAADLYETFARRQAANQEKRNAGQEPPEFSPSDAERIAVTETTRIHSEGELDASRDIESRGGKRLVAVWRTEPGACLVAGTLIRTATGDRPIETILPADLVWTRSGWRSAAGWT